MFGPSFHHAASDDEFDLTPSITSTKFVYFGRGRASEQTSRVQPVQAAHHTATPASNPPSVFLEDIFSWDNFPAGTPHQKFTVTAWSNSSAPLPPSAFPKVSNTSDASGGYLSQSGPPESLGTDSFCSQQELRAVTMPAIGHLLCNGGLVNAYGSSSDGFNNHTTSYYPNGISPFSISMSSMSGAGISNDPTIRSVPILPLYSVRPTSAFPSPRLFNPVAHSITPGEGFGTDPYLSLSRPSSPISLHTETSLNHVYPQPNVTTCSDQDYTIIVPSKDVVFPSFKSTEKLPFFRCRWKNCDAWITSEGCAIKHHITGVHGVQKNDEGSYTCEWAGCSKPREWSGLVRHVQKHIRLQWQCSVCGALRARRDCVRRHAKESGCKDAHPIRYPGELAYTAKENGNDTVTLTKMPQPK